MTRDGSPEELDEALSADAALYALDALGEAERGSFEERLSSSPALRDEVRALREAAGLLAAPIPPLPPPPGLKARLLARVRAGAASPVPGLHEARARDSAWEPTGFPGVSMRRLHRDPATGLHTFLVRMEPGSSYPAHRHAGPEQCLVLEGDLRFGDRTYGAGDFIWADPGSEHPALRSAGGNLLLIQSDPHDEIRTGG